MRTMNSATAPTANEGSMRPGEFQHYYLNFLALFGQRRALLEIEQAAHAAVAWRDAEIERFDAALRAMHAHYLDVGPDGGDPVPHLAGWDEIDFAALRAAHGGVLVALFHYGRHRQVLADLAVMGERFIAPVAKHAYFDCSRIAAVASPRFGEAMRLIEVESPRVGRELLKGLRDGRLGLIYVDGNMGPDGHLVEEGAVAVDFLGHRIRVKEGIARLAQGLGLPVLPLFATAPVDGGPACVRAGRLLSLEAHADPAIAASLRQVLMQSLYEQLGALVREAPAPWEFGFCLHRWIQPATTTPDPVMPEARASTAAAWLQVQPERIAPYQRDGELYWVDVRRQKAFRLPSWAHAAHAFLSACRRRREDVERWLQQVAPTRDEGVALLDELQSRGLLVPA